MTDRGVVLHFATMVDVGTFISPLLVGRDEFLDLADRRLRETAEGRGQMLLLAGEAGIGKTRFIGAIWDLARARGYRVTGGYLAPQDRDVSAASILDLARNAVRHPELGPLGLQLLALRDVVTGVAPAGRRRLVLEIVSIIDRLVDRPTALIFEDLQWADDVSLEIIAELARTTRERPLLIVGAYRLDEAAPGTSLRDWRSRLLTQRIAEELRLAPLDRAQTGLVTTLILDTGLPAPSEVVDAVYERTDGVPLHIEELLGAMSAQARADGRAIREADVPATIEDAVLERLSRRSAEAQAVARAGAVIGRCFVPEVLAEIMDLPVDRLDDPIQELTDNGVLDRPDPRGLIDFRHQLLRDAIYRSIPLRDRRRFHARAGEFGTRLEGQSEIHSSRHFELAGNRRRAYESALAGARQAASMSAHREAAELYRRSVANVPRDHAPAGFVRVLLALADEAFAVQDHDVAERAARDAIVAARAAGDPVAALEAESLLVSVGIRDGMPGSEVIARVQRLLDEADETADHDTREIRADLALTLAVSRSQARDARSAREGFALVRRLGADLGDPEWSLCADWKEAVTDFFEGDLQDAIERVVAVAREAERHGFESMGVSAFRDAALMAGTVMDYPAAARWMGEGLRYADAIEQSFCAHVLRANAAFVDWATGTDWDAAAEKGRQAVADRGSGLGAARARWAVGYVAMSRGEGDAARHELEAALRTGETSEIIDMILPPLWGLAESALLDGDPERAAELCRDAMDRARLVGERVGLVPFVVTGVRADQAAGRPARAAAWLGSCAAYLDGVAGIADTAIAHGRGLVTLADGATGVARDALETALAGWDALGRIWEASWARLDLASCLARSNRFAEAVACAVEVRATATRLGARPLTERADALQRMARGRFAADEPWRPLTAREFEVARLVTEGRTNVEIAGSLGIAPRTASSHVEHILAKLGASRRAEIAAWASSVERSGLPH